MSMQAKLLTVLQDRQFERVGGTRPIPLNTRIISASNADIRQRIAEGRFRADLFYRLNVIDMEMCPLRERLEDLPELLDAFLQKFNHQLGAAVEDGIDPADDRRQRRPDVVGNGAQKISAHFLLLDLGAQFFLLLDLRGERADGHGDGQHHDKRQRIARKREVEGVVGIGKYVVDAEHANNRGQQAEEIPAGKARDEHDGQLEDQRDEYVAFVKEPQKMTQERGQHQNDDADAEIPPAEREQRSQPQTEAGYLSGRYCFFHNPHP